MARRHVGLHRRQCQRFSFLRVEPGYNDRVCDRCVFVFDAHPGGGLIDRVGLPNVVARRTILSLLVLHPPTIVRSANRWEIDCGLLLYPGVLLPGKLHRLSFDVFFFSTGRIVVENGLFGFFASKFRLNVLDLGLKLVDRKFNLMERTAFQTVR